MAKRVKNVNFPWSIKGVSTEARGFAKTAASKNGLTMGDWLSKVIRDDMDEAKGNSEVDSKQGAGSGGGKTSPTVPHLNNDSVIKKLGETEERVLEAIKPLSKILMQLSLRLEALESRQETDS